MTAVEYAQELINVILYYIDEEDMHRINEVFNDAKQIEKKQFEKLKDLDDLNQLAFEEENLQVQKEVLQNIKDLRSEVKKNEIKKMMKIIKDEMISVANSDYHSFSIPLTVDINSGKDWASCHK